MKALSVTFFAVLLTTCAWAKSSSQLFYSSRVFDASRAAEFCAQNGGRLASPGEAKRFYREKTAAQFRAFYSPMGQWCGQKRLDESTGLRPEDGRSLKFWIAPAKNVVFFRVVLELAPIPTDILDMAPRQLSADLKMDSFGGCTGVGYIDTYRGEISMGPNWWDTAYALCAK